MHVARRTCVVVTVGIKVKLSKKLLVKSDAILAHYAKRRV